jgi:hypothetical protein
VNAIGQFSDGLPFSVASGTALGDGLTPRAQLLPGFGNGSLPKGQRTLGKWFNTAAFAVPAAGTWGNSGRNSLEGPGTKTVDFSVFKDTHLTESKVLQLRAEVLTSPTRRSSIFRPQPLIQPRLEPSLRLHLI